MIKRERILFIALLLIVLGWVGCTNSTDSYETVEVDETFAEDLDLDGMIRVFSTGKQVLLGTNDSTASADERPQMKVFFDYDFSIGQHEVTCGEFNNLVPEKTGLSLDCDDKQLPATNVTFYDAVIYANALSKKNGLDTAYSYTRMSFDQDHHCLNLEGFVFHPNVEAYRLPTEMEWVFSANKFWDVENDWLSHNSGYEVHQVCSVKSSVEKSEICDMTGNVMEWVNDWSGTFYDLTLTNYVGPPDGGTLDKRILKGGSYRRAKDSVSLYRRGDVHLVNSTVHTDYLGFRLAYGKIPNAIWVDNDGHVLTSHLVSMANSQTLNTFVETSKAKLVFRNDDSGNLVLIDYSTGYQKIHEILDTLDVFYPDVSPNGSLVAFSTAAEGNLRASSLYVRSIDPVSSNVVKLNVPGAAMPHWRVLDNGDTVIVYVTGYDGGKDEDDFAQGSTWQVKFEKGEFGKPQKIFDRPYHGGISTDGRLAVTGSGRLHARVNGRDTVWYDSMLVSNVRLSKSDENRTMFLDFAAKTGLDFAGMDYDAKTMLLVVDSTGTLVQSVRAPKGYAFDHLGWATRYMALVTLTNDSGSHFQIALLNLVNGSVIPLVEGNELWHPCLWVKKEMWSIDESLNVDSAGVYYTAAGGESAIIMRYKMELLWKYKDSANVVFMGSSRTLAALNPEKMSSSFYAINLSSAPTNVYVDIPFLENYILPHVKNLKYLVVGLDIDFWWKSYDVDNFFASEYQKYPGYVYDENHGYWEKGAPAGIYELAHSSLGMLVYEKNLMPHRGFQESNCLGWGEGAFVDHDSTWYEANPQLFYDSFNQLKTILEMAKNREIIVIGVIFPQSPGYQNSGSFGRYGLQRSVAPSLISEIKNLSKTYSNFILLDENKMGNHDYDEGTALNWDHLCTKGAEKLTARVDSLLQTLE